MYNKFNSEERTSKNQSLFTGQTHFNGVHASINSYTSKINSNNSTAASKAIPRPSFQCLFSSLQLVCHLTVVRYKSQFSTVCTIFRFLNLSHYHNHPFSSLLCEIYMKPEKIDRLGNTGLFAKII